MLKTFQSLSLNCRLLFLMFSIRLFVMLYAPPLLFTILKFFRALLVVKAEMTCFMFYVAVMFLIFSSFLGPLCTLTSLIFLSVIWPGSLFFFEVYYILTRRMGKSAFFHSDFTCFACNTRSLAVHVAIKNKIQHLAKLTRLSPLRVTGDLQPIGSTNNGSNILDAAYMF